MILPVKMMLSVPKQFCHLRKLMAYEALDPKPPSVHFSTANYPTDKSCPSEVSFDAEVQKERVPPIMKHSLVPLTILLLSVSPVYSDTASELEKACIQNIAQSCYTLAQSSEYGSELAVNSYRRACELGFDFACADLAFVQIDRKVTGSDRTEMMNILFKTCSDGIATSCTALAIEVTKDDDQSHPEVQELLEVACGLGDNSACEMVGKSFSAIVLPPTQDQ
jgi:hypothetical protein